MLRADNTGGGTGTVNFALLGSVDYSQSTGTVSIYYNPTAVGGGTEYQNPTIFACSGLCLNGGVLVNSQRPFQLTSYMLVSNESDLQVVGTTLGGTYALGNSFTAADFTGFAPGTIFTGIFDGNGGISATNYTVSGLTATLFPVVGNGATVRNINLADVNISALSPTFLGALAGENRGTISNVHVLSGRQRRIANRCPGACRSKHRPHRQLQLGRHCQRRRFQFHGSHEHRGRAGRHQSGDDH